MKGGSNDGRDNQNNNKGNEKWQRKQQVLAKDK
jgi:hypothetical protein